MLLATPFVDAKKYSVDTENITFPSSNLNVSIKSFPESTTTYTFTMRTTATILENNGNAPTIDVTLLYNSTSDSTIRTIPASFDGGGMRVDSACTNPSTETFSFLGLQTLKQCNIDINDFLQDYLISSTSTDWAGSKSSIINRTITFYDAPTCLNNSRTTLTGTHYAREFYCYNSDIHNTNAIIYFGNNRYPHAVYNLTNSKIFNNVDNRAFFFSANASINWFNVNATVKLETYAFNVFALDDAGAGHNLTNTIFYSGQLGLDRDNSTLLNFSIEKGYLFMEDCENCKIDYSSINNTKENPFISGTGDAPSGFVYPAFTLFDNLLKNTIYRFTHLRLALDEGNTNNGVFRQVSFNKTMQTFINDSNIYISNNGYDIDLVGGNLTFYNVTYNRDNVIIEYDNDTLLTNYFYLDINVKNDTGENIQNANISIWDNSSVLIYNAVTNAQGNYRKPLLNYIQKNVLSQKIYPYSNYTINITFTDKQNKSCSNYTTSMNMSFNRQIDAILTCTSDLPPEPPTTPASICTPPQNFGINVFSVTEEDITYSCKEYDNLFAINLFYNRDKDETNIFNYTGWFN